MPCSDDNLCHAPFVDVKITICLLVVQYLYSIQAANGHAQ